MHVQRIRDFYAGLLFMGFGIGAMVLCTGYQIGNAARMGPGYFPFALGAVLTLLGLAVCLRSLARGRGARGTRSIPWKPLVLVLSSVILFGLLLRPLGLICSTAVLVLVSSMASAEFRKAEAMVNTLVLLAIVLTCFVYFLKFQIPVLPAFLG